jgi:hypothetical protein
MKNDIFSRVLNFLESKSRHRYCEDPWYSCPENEDYIGPDSGCDCGAIEAQNLLEVFKNGEYL